MKVYSLRVIAQIHIMAMFEIGPEKVLGSPLFLTRFDAIRFFTEFGVEKLPEKLPLIGMVEMEIGILDNYNLVEPERFKAQFGNRKYVGVVIVEYQEDGQVKYTEVFEFLAKQIKPVDSV